MILAKKLIQPVVVFIVGLLLISLIGLLADGDYFRFALSKGQLSPVEEKAIRRTITQFNSLFADLSASMGKTSSDTLPATKAMRHKLYMDTGTYAMAKQVLVYDMASLEISSVKWQDPQTAVVVAKEAWNYQYRNAADRGELDIIKGMDDQFRYLLVKQNGKWLVHRSSGILKEIKS